MSRSFLYGLGNSNHDFTAERSFGKNIFTNAFPVALAAYIDGKGLGQNYVSAAVGADGSVGVKHGVAPLSDLIGVEAGDAFWAFEDSFSGYNSLSTGTANRSDLVVKDLSTGRELSAFEVKLVAAPTSGTANRLREQQSCEIVVRPPTIEQMCFSVASSYGLGRRHDIGDMIASKLGNPMDYQWSNEAYMLERLPLVVAAAEEIIREGIGAQTPFVLNALWRTQGKSTVFDPECFDVFFWSDLAFLQLFTRAAHRAIATGKTCIGRPERSVVWFVKSLFDYAVQSAVTFEKTHGQITYGGQTDKAGAFSGSAVMDLLRCNHFDHPRIAAEEYESIISPEGIALLSPERRLDGFIKARFDYFTVRLDPPVDF